MKLSVTSQSRSGVNLDLVLERELRSTAARGPGAGCPPPRDGTYNGAGTTESHPPQAGGCSAANSNYCVWLHFPGLEAAEYLHLHSTQNFRAKAKFKLHTEEHAKAYSLILLQWSKERKTTIFFKEEIYKRKLHKTHTDQFYT